MQFCWIAFLAIIRLSRAQDGYRYPKPTNPLIPGGPLRPGNFNDAKTFPAYDQNDNNNIRGPPNSGPNQFMPDNPAVSNGPVGKPKNGYGPNAMRNKFGNEGQIPSSNGYPREKPMIPFPSKEPSETEGSRRMPSQRPPSEYPSTGDSNKFPTRNPNDISSNGYPSYMPRTESPMGFSGMGKDSMTTNGYSYNRPDVGFPSPGGYPGSKAQSDTPSTYSNNKPGFESPDRYPSSKPNTESGSGYPDMKFNTQRPGGYPSNKVDNGPSGGMSSNGPGRMNKPIDGFPTNQDMINKMESNKPSMSFGSNGNKNFAGNQNYPGSQNDIFSNMNNPNSDDNSIDEGDYSAIPGEPGKDYPIYADIPKTSFSCDMQQYPGYYADVEAQCQVFHVCANNQTYDFLCPNGTIFHQEYLVCVWWNQFDCSSAPSLYYINENIYDYTIFGNQQGMQQPNKPGETNVARGPGGNTFSGSARPNQPGNYPGDSSSMSGAKGLDGFPGTDASSNTGGGYPTNMGSRGSNTYPDSMNVNQGNYPGQKAGNVPMGYPFSDKPNSIEGYPGTMTTTNPKDYSGFNGPQNYPGSKDSTTSTGYPASDSMNNRNIPGSYPSGQDMNGPGGYRGYSAPNNQPAINQNRESSRTDSMSGSNGFNVPRGPAYLAPKPNRVDDMNGYPRPQGPGSPNAMGSSGANRPQTFAPPLNTQSPGRGDFPGSDNSRGFSREPAQTDSSNMPQLPKPEREYLPPRAK